MGKLTSSGELEEWAEENEVAAEGREIVHNPDVLELISEEINRLTEDLPHYERVKEFALLSEDFTTENGMLTPTLKVKRRIVLDHYSDELDRLYQ